MTVGSEDGAPQAVAAVVVPVHFLGGVERRLEPVSGDEPLDVMGRFQVVRGDVHQSHRVVSPMGDGQPTAVGGGGDHLGQDARRPHACHLIGSGVDRGHGGGLLGILVVAAMVIGDP